MPVKRGEFSSVLDIVRYNTGMTEKEPLYDQKTYRINGLSEAKDMLTQADKKALHMLLEDIQKYGPYGRGNPQPVLFIKGLLITPIKYGCTLASLIAMKTAGRYQEKESGK